MDTFTIEGFPFISGDVELIQDPFRDLNIRDRITKIGIPGRSGKTTSAHRVDTWLPWIEYSGTIVLEIGTVKSNWLAFKLPPGGLKNRDGSDVEEAVYVLYSILEKSDEILRPNFSRNNVYIFKSVFTKFNPDNI